MNDDFDSTAAVRKRPGMYVGPFGGGADPIGMVQNAVGHAINQVLAGNATKVSVFLNADGSCTVFDDGPGLPTAFERRYGKSVAEQVMTSLHSGALYVPDGCPTDSLCIVNALSSSLTVVIWQNGKKHRMSFRSGEPVTPLSIVGDAAGRHGTELTFFADPSIFGDETFDRVRLSTTLQRLAKQHKVQIDFAG